MKPRQKIVTAEDIQSSLYYFHVDRHHDELHTTPSGEQNEAETYGVDTMGPITSTPVHRKALPTLPSAVRDQDSASDQLSVPNASPSTPVSLFCTDPLVASYSPTIRAPLSNSSKLTTRKPVAPLVLAARSDASNCHNTGAAVVSRRPVGTQPIQRHRGLSDIDIGPVRGRENTDPSLGKRIRTTHDISMRSPSAYEIATDSWMNSDSHASGGTTGVFANFRSISPDESTTYNEENGYGLPASLCRRVQASPRRRANEGLTDLDMSITAIRRDPTSGAQWNVGKIRHPPALEVSSEALKGTMRTSRQVGAPMYIEISNPGYSKFLSLAGQRISLDSTNNRSSIKTTDAFDNNTLSDPSYETTVSDGLFKRRLWYEGSRLSDRSFGHRKTSSTESHSGVEAPRRSLDILSFAENRTADASLGLGSLALERQRVTAIPGTEKRSSAVKSYTFVSPWNGRCEFSSGFSGRSLLVRECSTASEHELVLRCL